MKKVWLIVALLLISVGVIEAQQKYAGGALMKTGHPSAKDIVAYYPVSEGSGPTVFDVSGNTNDGTLVDGVNWAASSRGSVLDFDGSSGYVNCGRLAEIESISEFSAEIWFKQDSLNARGWLYGKGVAASGLALFTYDGLLYLEVAGNANRGYLDYSLYVNAGEWAHLGVVFDGNASGNSGRLQLYINGVQRTLTYAGTIPALTTSQTDDLFLGTVKNPLAEWYWDDRLCCIKFWNRALSDAEIRDNYLNRYAMLQRQQVWNWFVPIGITPARGTIFNSPIWRGIFR